MFLSILQPLWEKGGANLTCPILQLILWQIRIALNLKIPAVQLDNGPIFYMAQDLGHWLICITLTAEYQPWIVKAKKVTHQLPPSFIQA